jgi:hypothetical protein
VGNPHRYGKIRTRACGRVSFTWMKTLPRPQRLKSRATRDFSQFGLGCAPVGPKRNASKRQLLGAKIYASGQQHGGTGPPSPSMPTYITQRENATPFGAVYVMLAVPADMAQARPFWFTYITKGLLDAQVPLAP